MTDNQSVADNVDLSDIGNDLNAEMPAPVVADPALVDPTLADTPPVKPVMSKAEIAQAKELFVKQMIENANTIYDNLYDPKIKAMPEDEKLALFQKQYSEFNNRFPLVIRYMVQMRMYHPEAFRLLIHKTLNCPAQSMDDFLRNQSSYVGYLYRKLNPHGDTKMANKAREDAYNVLKHETESFEKTYKEKQEVLNKKHEEYTQQKKAELKALFKQRQVA